MNTPYYISGREKTNPPSRVSSSRYQFLALKDAEPNLGVPLTNALPASATFLLTTNLAGDRTWLTSLLYDSTYTTFRGTSGNFVSVFNTVQGNSGRWTSAYTTLNTNSGTWLTVTSANSLYFKVSGGEIDGNVRVNGDMIVIGVLSALGGIDVIDTKVIETSSLRLVNIGAGPALYVEQAGLDNIAEFYDTEGGAALIVGNIAPVGLHNGVIGVCTTTPNETLTVKGTFSASGDVYTFGRIISAGVLLDEIILNAIPATLQSVYATVSANSGSWTSVYNSWNTTSANYTTKQFLSTNFISLCSIDVLGNVNIFGNLVATGSAFFTNTIISTTSALSVINTEQGPALFVSQGKGSGNIAEFYDSDYGDVVFSVGNAVDLTGNVRNGVIGIKTSNPDKTLTVQGEISASGYINSSYFSYSNENLIIGRDVPLTYVLGGFRNLVLGSSTSPSLAFGSNNTIMGWKAGYLATDGIENTLIGSQAAEGLTLGNRNTIIGSAAGKNLDTGNLNIFLGYNAGFNNTVGSNNIIIGRDAGTGIVTGNYNIIIGSEANGNDNSRVVLIGPEARASNDFQFVAGSASFPFVNGIYYGDLSFYGELSATDSAFGSLTSVGNATVHSNLTVDGNLEVKQNIFNKNSTSTSLSTGAIVLSGAAGAIVLDDGGHKRISWNDGGGNFNIRGGNYFGNGAVRYAKGTSIGETNPGAATITLNTDNQNGYISLSVATAGTPNTSVSYSNLFELTTTYASLCSPVLIGGTGSAPSAQLEVLDRAPVTSIDSANQVLSLRNSSSDQSSNLTGIRLRQENATNSANAFIGMSSTGTSATRASIIVASPNTSGNATERLRFSSDNVATFTAVPQYAADPAVDSNTLTRQSYVRNLFRWTRVTSNTLLDATIPVYKLAVDSTGGAFTITLPATPSEGQEVEILDGGRFATFNNITIARNGRTINGDADTMVIDKNGSYIKLVYIINDWKIVGVA